MGTARMGRAFSPAIFGFTMTWGEAPGWDGGGPLALVEVAA